MEKKKLYNNRIISSSIWNFIGTFMLKAIAFISVPIFTRLMTQSDYGLYATYATYISFLTILIGLSLNTATANARMDFPTRFDDYNSSIIRASTIVFFVELLLANILFPFYAKALSLTRLYLNIIFIVAYAEYVVQTYYRINIVDFHFKTNLRISITNAVSSIVLSVLLVIKFENDVLGRLIGQGLILFLFAIGLYCLIGIKRSKQFCIADVKYASKLAIPNVFHQISHIILAQSDKVFILNLCGSIQVAKYSVMYNFGLIMQVLWNAINEVWVPWLYRKLRENNFKVIVKMSKIYLYLFTFITSVAILVVPDFVIVFAPASYFDAKPIIPSIMLAMYFMFIYSFFVNIEMYYKKNKYLAIATIIATSINVIGNAIFIPKYGYWAAAYTTLFSYIILMLMHYCVLTFVIKKNIYGLKMFLVPIISMMILGIYVYKFVYDVFPRYIVLFIMLATAGIMTIKKRKEIREFVDTFRR